MRRVALAISLLTLMLPVTAGAGSPQPRLEAADPLGLVEDAVWWRQFGQGTDTWSIWACNTTDATALDMDDVQETVDHFTDEIAPIFAWMSEGRYSPTFAAGGVIDTGIAHTSRTGDCDENSAAVQGLVGVNGAIFVSNFDWNVGGVSDPGRETEGAFFPANDRAIWLDQSDAPSDTSITTFLLTHEMGHTLGWPHSSGEIPFDDGFDRGNPMDVMGCCGPAVIARATVAINRYQAGWFDSDQVAVLGNAGGTFTIGAIGYAGTQMVVIPTGIDYRYVTLGVRDIDPSGYDTASSLDAEGVEVYEVDGNCEPFDCSGTGRRIRAVPSTEFISGDWINPHVHGVGDTFSIGNRTITVDSKSGDGSTYTVTISASAKCLGMFPTIIGTSVEDTLTGTPGTDVIVGLGADDSLDGGGGDDFLCGNAGDDELIGGSGSDQLDGGSGDDEMFGNGGDDILLGRSGNDLLEGNGGKDILKGQGDADTLKGGRKGDVLLGGNGADTLRGNQGKDTLKGGAGDDDIDGGPGFDTANGGAGVNTCIAEVTSNC